MSKKIAFLSKVTITTNNYYIDVWDSAGGDQSVALPATTYTDMRTVCSVLQALIRTLGGVYADLTIVVGSTGRVTFDVGSGDTFIIKFGTGSHASTSLRDVLGFAHSDTSDAQTHESDYQHQYGWYANEGIKVDSKNREILRGGASIVAMDGTVYRTTWNSGDNIVREIELQFITPEKFFSDEAGTNESFQDWWLDAAAGNYFEYYTDSENFASSDTGQWALEVQDDSNTIDGITRESPGAEYYQGVKLRLRKQ